MVAFLLVFFVPNPDLSQVEALTVPFPTVSTDAWLCFAASKCDSSVLGRFFRHNLYVCRLWLTSQGAWFDSGVEDPCECLGILT